MEAASCISDRGWKKFRQGLNQRKLQEGVDELLWDRGKGRSAMDVWVEPEGFKRGVEASFSRTGAGRSKLYQQEWKKLTSRAVEGETTLEKMERRKF